MSQSTETVKCQGCLGTKKISVHEPDGRITLQPCPCCCLDEAVASSSNTPATPDDAPDLKQAEEILEEYTKPYSMIDNGNLFFAAHEFKKALAARDDELRALRESLEWALDSMCHHNATRPGSGREWCLHCSAWIYPSDKEMRAKADQLVTLKEGKP